MVHLPHFPARPTLLDLTRVILPSSDDGRPSLYWSELNVHNYLSPTMRPPNRRRPVVTWGLGLLPFNDP